MPPLQLFGLKVILLPFITECVFHLGAYQTQRKYKFGKTCICHIDYSNAIYNALPMFLNSCMFQYLRFIFLICLLVIEIFTVCFFLFCGPNLQISTKLLIILIHSLQHHSVCLKDQGI